ncbi:hypothetical protein B0H13DRAFT_1869732 [Mycena leptocephala]|nr:hypothetical protein B0H13DRAFT_1869732 [Mycena leptocephala]
MTVRFLTYIKHFDAFEMWANLKSPARRTGGPARADAATARKTNIPGDPEYAEDNVLVNNSCGKRSDPLIDSDALAGLLSARKLVACHHRGQYCAKTHETKLVLTAKIRALQWHSVRLKKQRLSARVGIATNDSELRRQRAGHAFQNANGGTAMVKMWIALIFAVRAG